MSFPALPSGRCHSAKVTGSSGLQTAGANVATFADYSGDRNIGRVERRGDGVYFFTAEDIRRFSFPAAGEIGTAGRNTFRGPRFFNIDLSLGKRFRIKERQDLSFRAEAYNLSIIRILAIPVARRRRKRA
jgi:hypothetical protein